MSPRFVTVKAASAVAIAAAVYSTGSLAQGTMELRPTRASGTEGIDWELGPGVNDITLASGGQSVEFELFVSGWGAGELLTSYQASLDCSQFDSGAQGVLAPILLYCEDAAPGDFCQVVDGTRPDRVFGDVTAIEVCDINTMCGDGSPGKIRCGAMAYLPLGSGNTDGGGPAYYGATFALDVPSDAKGTFTVGLDPDALSTFMTLYETTDIWPAVIPGTITVTTGSCCFVPGGLHCADGVTAPECGALTGLFSPGAVCCDVDNCGNDGIDDACPTCHYNMDCDDGNACTQDICGPYVLPNGCETIMCRSTDNTPEGMCCNPSTGVLIEIDDGDPCTIDTCNPYYGTVWHVPDPVCIPIPAASSWGVACMALLVLTTATLVFRPSRGMIQPR